MFLIAGLGNPGLKYSHTRHNAGFDAISYIAGKYDIKIKKKECRSLTGSGIINGEKVLLVKPQTYMNKSGEAIKELLNYYHIDAENDLIVLSDDIMLPVGKLRIRRKGSAGGHNGLKDIIKNCDTEDFTRIRIGIGDVKLGDELIDHVLKKIPRDDRRILDTVYENAANAIPYLLEGKIDIAMNRFN